MSPKKVSPDPGEKEQLEYLSRKYPEIALSALTLSQIVEYVRDLELKPTTVTLGNVVLTVEPPSNHERR